MKTNEVIKMLNITKESLRYYEKEGLIYLPRYTNNYREYQYEEIEMICDLRTISKVGKRT